MITAVVQFKLPKGTKREDMIGVFKATAPNYRGIPGLIRKYYLYGDEGTAGGAYLWESREAADAVYTDDWRKMVAERYGSEPEIAYFETPVVVDNVSGDVIAEAAE
jgi:hypothetical protein